MKEGKEKKGYSKTTRRISGAEIKTKKELEISDEKQSQDNSPLHKEETCQRPGCDKKAIGRCKYCNRAFCEEHIKPTLVISPYQIWNLNTIKTSDPEKYKKYMEDWKRTDGHPCPEYTEFWNNQHEIKL
ncbi:MAG: hypothetical protein ACP5HJ_03880, partial [Candidatus Micrarchaeia archaeon]